MRAPSDAGLELWASRAAPNESGRDFAHRLLRQLLSSRLGVAPQDLTFDRERCPVCGGPNGRPILAEPFEGLHFSLARDGACVLVAIAEVPVGVDLQALCDRETASEVAGLLHFTERNALESLPERRRAEEFTRLWTRKEAYLKGIGTGIGHGLDQAIPPAWSVHDLSVAYGYAAAVALQPALSAR